MSFSLTEEQLLDGTKDVTRRLGWHRLKAGETVRAVRKAMGLKKGEKVHRLGIIRIVSVRSERLDAITMDDVIREGFGGMSVGGFIEMFCGHMGCQPGTPVTRIEFRRLCSERDNDG